MFAYTHDFTPDVEINYIGKGYFDLSETPMMRTVFKGLAVALVKGGQPTNVTQTFWMVLFGGSLHSFRRRIIQVNVRDLPGRSRLKVSPGAQINSTY